MADVCLYAFGDTHLQIDAVTHDVHLGRLQLVEQVTVVPIQVAHGIVILGEAFVEQFLVVHITFLHAQRLTQLVGGINGVAHPCDVADEILTSLVHLHIHIHMLLVVVPNAVGQDGGITVTIFIVFLYQILLVFLPPFRGKLLRLEDIGKLTCLMGLGEGSLAEHSTLDFRIRQVVIALDDNVAHLHLLFLVDDNIENYLVLVRHIITLVDGNLGIFVTLVVEIALGQDFGTVEDVWRHLPTLDDTQFLLHILTLRLLQTDIVDSRDTRTYRQLDV